MVLSLLAAAALLVAGVSLFRLSRLPPPKQLIDERTFDNLREGDVVLSPEGEWLVAGREPLGAAAVFALRSGRDKRWLLVGEAGPLALLPAKPETTDPERAVAALGGRKLDRATVDLLPGQSLLEPPTRA
jgi:hypothetical protein